MLGEKNSPIKIWDIWDHATFSRHVGLPPITSPSVYGLRPNQNCQILRFSRPILKNSVWVAHLPTQRLGCFGNERSLYGLVHGQKFLFRIVRPISLPEKVEGMGTLGTTHVRQKIIYPP